MAEKDRFYPKHKEKYVGDPTKIWYRSSWEKQAMIWFDENPAIICWSSEELTIPYYDPIAKKKRRYYPDFVIKARGKDGSEKVMMIEVKPLRQCNPPVKKKRVTKAFIKEYCAYKTNEAKWKAAKLYCEKNNWKFLLVTENNLGMFG